jgi:ATP-dependent helicase/nuclease subunit B
MMLHAQTASLDQPFLRQLTRWVLAKAPRATAGDLTGVLILLPGIRPCATLKHLLLEESGRQALLLPQVTTVEHWVEYLAARAGLLERATVPNDLRGLLLAQRLPQLDWIKDHPECAPGLAEELVALFDEVRRYGCWRRLLAEQPLPDLPELASAAAVELFHLDGQRLRDAWLLYRQLVPYDAVDRLLEVAELIERQSDSPPPRYDLAVIAGFTDLDPTTTGLIRAGLKQVEGHVFALSADDPLSRLLLISYSDPDGAGHPLVPARRLSQSLCAAGQPIGPAATGRSRAERMTQQPPAKAAGELYRQRLTASEPSLAEFRRQGLLEMLACSDPEQESRAVANLVVEELQDHARKSDNDPEGLPRIAVATADRQLARRIVAQLRDAGIDVDDTGGMPLSQLPSGVLALMLLRSVMTDLQHGPLLELLTHPFVDLYKDRRKHARQVLRFESMLRGKHPPTGGLRSYRRLAVEWDEHVDRLWHSHAGQMQQFVAKLGEALQPLLAAGSQERAAWGDHLAAFRLVWNRVAPERALHVEDEHQDQQVLAQLLDSLERLVQAPEVAGRLPPITLADFAATFSRLVAAQVVRPRRSQFLPVQITGLLEARLEHYDLLILAGMSEDVFPGRKPRPQFLSDLSRRSLGLPGWRDQLAADAELFLRLLHNGSEVVITWPEYKLGQPCLPSPLVVRLDMSGFVPCARAASEPLYRKPQQAPLQEEIIQSQREFSREPAAIPVQAGSRPLVSLSHSGLKTYRDCPYRFLLERGYGLKQEQEVLEEFRRLDYGQLVHSCLHRFLQPQAAGQSALAAGDKEQALHLLQQATEAVFMAGNDQLPQRRLWQETFRATWEALVACELERFASGWRPRLLEGSFKLPLIDLRDWLLAHKPVTTGQGDVPELPNGVPPPVLTGVIDRIDLPVDGAPAVAVIDYKTGQLPSIKNVRQGQELQISLYALAIETGRVTGLPAQQRWRVAQGAYYKISSDQSGFDPHKPHLEVGTPEGRQNLWQGALAILQTALAARDRSHPYALVPNHWHRRLPGTLPCDICPHDAICRLEERALPSHLEIQLRKKLSTAPRS